MEESSSPGVGSSQAINMTGSIRKSARGASIWLAKRPITPCPSKAAARIGARRCLRASPNSRCQNVPNHTRKGAAANRGRLRAVPRATGYRDARVGNANDQRGTTWTSRPRNRRSPDSRARARRATPGRPRRRARDGGAPMPGQPAVSHSRVCRRMYPTTVPRPAASRQPASALRHPGLTPILFI